MLIGEVACSYTLMILHDDGIAVTSEKITAMVEAADVEVESYWPSLFTKLAEKRNTRDLILNAGAISGSASVAATPATEEKKEDPKEVSDHDMGVCLFD
ncbi:hypothetical protein UlMin_017371 [Ulmus minor]